MRYRGFLFLVMAAGLVLNVLVEWSNFYQPYDEGLEVILFLIVLLSLTLLYRDDKINRQEHPHTPKTP